MAGLKPRRLLRRIGPGIITAAVVLGPGSILSASRVGAEFGYSLIWLLICAAIFMAVFTAMGARIGCVTQDSLLQTIRRRYGRWPAILLGVCGWLVAAGFQFGNNLGVATAMNGLLPGLVPWAWPVLFTIASIGFLLGAKNLYRLVEWLMICLVGVMISAFVANLFYAGVDVAQAAHGLIPRVPPGKAVAAMALVATTFSIVAAFAQAYFVQEKKWGIDQYRTGMRDAWLGIAILGTMTLTIMLCAAAAFGGKGIVLKTAGDVAVQLRDVFGTSARYIFCLGLAAASFSSFVANAMIGGLLLADGLNLGHRLDSTAVKVAASAALLVGMAVATVMLAFGVSPVGSIIVAQAMTLLVAPLCGIFLLVVANSRLVMSDHRNRWPSNLVAALGLAVVLYLTWLNAVKVWETGASLFRRWFG